MFPFLHRLLKSTHSRRPAPLGRSIRPQLETLESRLAPAVFNVNSLADVLNPAAGTVTLRSAIQQANATPGADVINLTIPGIYSITLPGAPGEVDNQAGEFAITAAGGSLTIVNTSGGSVAVDGNHLARVFDINPVFTVGSVVVTNGGTGYPATPSVSFTGGGGTGAAGTAVVTGGKITGVTLSNVGSGYTSAPTISFGGPPGSGATAVAVMASPAISVTMQGFAIQNGLATGAGGGIRDQGNASLTLNSMVVADNGATGDGGGVAMQNALSALWTLTVNSSTIRNNRAGDAGGGIETDGAGVVNINPGTVIVGNISLHQGGGVWLDEIAQGAVASIGVTNGGSGYTSAPTVTFSGGGGTGAAGTAIVSGGVVTGVTITNAGSGYVTAPTITFSSGAAAAVAHLTLQSGALTMTGAVVSNNAALGSGMAGGGVGNGGTGTVTISNSTLSSNFSAGVGGGFSDQNAADIVTIQNSLIVGNTAVNDGGGLFVGGPTLTINGVTLRGNYSGFHGGGLFADSGASALVVGSYLVNNYAANEGGAVFGAGPSTTLVSDVIQSNGSGLFGGGVFIIGPTLIVQNSTLLNNMTTGSGGGIELQATGSGAAGSSITNTTIVGNAALNSAGGTAGGGIDAPIQFSGTLTLINNAINGNYASTGGGVFWAGRTGSSFAVKNTIIAKNSAAIAGPDAANAAGTFADNGGNLLGVAGAGSGNTGFTNGLTQTGTIATPLDPRLDPLKNNGGPTVGGLGDSTALLTEALSQVSKAIDKGVAAGAPSVDERGFARPSNPGELPDVGALERQSAANSVFYLKADHSLWQTSTGSVPVMLSPAQTILSIASVTDDAGFDDVFAITNDNRLWEHSGAIPGGWQLLSIGSFQSISAATNQMGDAIVAAVLTDHSLWQYTTPYAGSYPWQLLSPAGTILSASAVTDFSLGYSREVIYAVTSDNRLWQHIPAGWTMISSGAFQQISAGFTGAGQAVVYAVGVDNSLTEFNAAFAGGFQVLSPAHTILSVSAGAADQVFAVTVDHRLWVHAAGWALLSVGNFQSISANSTNTGAGAVFGVLSDGTLWENNPAFPADGWHNILTGGVLSASAPRRY